jgi:hypothetical protein
MRYINNKKYMDNKWEMEYIKDIKDIKNIYTYEIIEYIGLKI